MSSATDVVKIGATEFALRRATGRAGRLAMARIMGAASELNQATSGGSIVFDEVLWSRIEDILPDLFCIDPEELEQFTLIEIVSALPSALEFHLGEAETPEVEEALKNSLDTAAE